MSFAGRSAAGVGGLEPERVQAISETLSVFRPRSVHGKHTRRVLAASRALGGFVPNGHVDLNGKSVVFLVPTSHPSSCTPRRSGGQPILRP
jgi:hypothetical protein